jgi:hypothetical protein
MKFVVGALRGALGWAWRQVGDCTVCTYVRICGVDLDGAAGCWSWLGPSEELLKPKKYFEAAKRYLIPNHVVAK